MDKRKLNTPPANNSIKRFNRTVSTRIEGYLIEELESLLAKKYQNKNVPMNSISFVIRSAIKKKIRELKGMVE